MSNQAVETKKQSSNSAPELKNLESLVGKWKEETWLKNDPDNGATGQNRFEWMDGGYFMVWRFDINFKKQGPHNGICVIGYDEASGGCTGHFFDNLGYAREYKVSLNNGVFKLTGQWERYTATLSQDRKTLIGTWEHSKDGSKWEYLCDTKQTKVE